MKRGWFLLIGFFALLLLINFYPQIKIGRLTGNAVISISDAQVNCDSPPYQQIWESVINEPYTGIVTRKINIGQTSQYCRIEAVKYIEGSNDTFVYYSLKKYTGSFYRLDYGYHIFRNASEFTFNNTNYQAISDPNMTVLDFVMGVDGHPAALRSSIVDDAAKAKQEFQTKFKIDIDAASDDDWSDTIYLNYTLGNGEQTTANICKSEICDSATSFILKQCMPNWTAINTTTCANETITTWYNDANSCGNITNRPQNITWNCDDDGNGIIGDLNSIEESNFDDLNILIEGSELNNSLIYNGTKLIVLSENGTEIVRFDHNFSAPLDLKNMIVKKQPSSFKYGYLIVNGIKDEKTFYVDRKNSSGRVCIKDSEIDSISAISSDCEDDDEYLLNCPGEDEGFICNISEGYFKVSGLTNSAVEEFTDSSLTVCLPNWNCTSSSNCTNGNYNLTCIDTQNCGTTIGRPALIQNCSTVLTVTECTTNWTCGEWLPKNCPESGNQTRTCTDNNNCGQHTKTENRACVYEAGMSIWTIILVGSIAAAAVIGIILVLMAVYRKKDYEKANQPYSPQPPTTPLPPTPPSTPPSAPMPAVSPVKPMTQPISQVPPKISPQPQPTNPALQLHPMAPKPA